MQIILSEIILTFLIKNQCNYYSFSFVLLENTTETQSLRNTVHSFPKIKISIAKKNYFKTK